MYFYILTDFFMALLFTLLMKTFMKISIKIQFKRKKLITKIEKELSSKYNYFNQKATPPYEIMLEKIIIESGFKIKINTLYILCFTCSILGAMIGYTLQFPFLILILTVTFFAVPIFVLFMIGAYKNFKSYKVTFKVLHTAEKASQLTNSPLIVFRKILPYLSERDKIYFEEFLNNFNINKPYKPLFEDLEKKTNNKFLKELVVQGRETSNGVNYNKAINLILDGYRLVYEMMEKRKQKINGLALFLYAISACFIGISIYISINHSAELQEIFYAQLFFKATILAVIASVILSSVALVNANQC